MNAVVVLPAPAALITGSLAPTVSRGLSRLVMALLFAQLWLAQSTLAAAQIGSELLLGATLVVMLRKCRLQRRETALLLVFGLSLAASLAVNPIPVTLLLAKVFGLAILSLLVFSRFRFDTTDAAWIIAMNVLLTVYQYFFGNPGWYLSIVLSVGETWREFAGSRPLGLFMSTHVSAVLTALFFLRLRNNPIFAGAGLLSVFVSGSTNVLLAYVSQAAQRLLAWLHLERLAIGFGIAAAVLLLVYAQTMLDIDLTALSDIVTGREQVSYNIIASQLLSPDYYVRAFTLIPGDPQLLYNEASGDWPNEIGYLSTLQQGGFVLGAGYLLLLVSRIGGFRTFMLIGMLHFSMQTLPLVVFLLLQWSDGMSPRGAPSETFVFVASRELR
jgi:hypothetical protein